MSRLPAPDLSWKVERVSPTLMGVMGQPYPYVAVSLLRDGMVMYSERVSRDDGEYINVYESPFELTHVAVLRAAERCLNNYRGEMHVDTILSKYKDL